VNSDFLICSILSPSLEAAVDAVDFLRLPRPAICADPIIALLKYASVYDISLVHSVLIEDNNRAMHTIGCAEGPEYLY
jgi:hypothetical protein